MAASFPAVAGRSVLATARTRLSPVLNGTFKNSLTLTVFQEKNAPTSVRLRSHECILPFARGFSQRRHAGSVSPASTSSSVQAPTKLDSDPSDTEKTKSSADCVNWTIKMLYDGDCPLCMREVNMLRERNKAYGTIKFVDISADNYLAEENFGIDFATAMARIHAILPDGTILQDIAAFQRLYEEVGLGWVYSFTKIKPVARIADAVYSVWAKYRLPITGRPPLIEILEARRSKAEAECKSDRCQLD